MANPRTIAFGILYKIQTENAYSNILLNQEIKANQLNKLDAAFVSALVYGVLERQITLDYILKQYSKLPVRKIEKKTLIVLRMGILQMLFMDKVPESAAVNESVKLAKKKGLVKSSGFINGILRSITRAEVKYTLPDEIHTQAYLSVTYSCPEQLVSLWLNAYGYENTMGILRSLSGRPPLTVNVNTLKFTKEQVIHQLETENIRVTSVPFLENALQIANTGSIENLQAYQKGGIFVQDGASQLCAALLNPVPGDTVLDVCSAPGGKAFASAIRMENKGRVYAYDLYEHKIKLIKNTAERLGISILYAKTRDAQTDTQPLPAANKVLCDVPCSGYGILRRKPEIRYKTDTIIDNIQDIQYHILCNSSKYTAIGGVLVYSTCTLNPAENGDNADRFLREHPNFEPVALHLPEGIARGIDEPENQLTLFPHITGTDGFFIAVFQRVRE